MEEELVISVKKVNSFEYEHNAWTGYEIVTTKQTIRVFIDDYQNCCEEYGVDMITPEGKDIVGDEVKSVEWGKATIQEKTSCDYRQTAVVHLETTSGLTQIVAYNEHNGYYPHSVYVEWNGYKDVQEI